METLRSAQHPKFLETGSCIICKESKFILVMMLLLISRVAALSTISSLWIDDSIRKTFHSPLTFNKNRLVTVKVSITRVVTNEAIPTKLMFIPLLERK